MRIVQNINHIFGVYFGKESLQRKKFTSMTKIKINVHKTFSALLMRFYDQKSLKNVVLYTFGAH